MYKTYDFYSHYANHLLLGIKVLGGFFMTSYIVISVSKMNPEKKLDYILRKIEIIFLILKLQLDTDNIN